MHWVLIGTLGTTGWNHLWYSILNFIYVFFHEFSIRITDYCQFLCSCIKVQFNNFQKVPFIYPFKVQVFWKGHKNLKKYPTCFGRFCFALTLLSKRENNLTNFLIKVGIKGSFSKLLMCKYYYKIISPHCDMGAHARHLGKKEIIIIVFFRHDQV